MILKTKRLFLYAIIVTLIGLSSCKKMPQHIGNSLQPNSSYIHVAFTDKTDIKAETERIDSLSTKAASLSLVGDLNDPIFGNSNLSFYTQVGLTSNSLQWGEGATTDSIVLQMIYSGYYGDTLTPMTMKVFEVTEEMVTSSQTYYSNTSFAHGDELASYDFCPRPRSRSNIDDDSLTAAVIRIPIYNSLGDKFMSEDASKFSSNKNFMNYFKGLYVACEPTSGTGSICYFNLLNTKSYLRVYYHNDYDTTFYDFTIGDKYVRFNHFEHDYESAQAPISFNDTLNQYLYVQSTAGVRSRITFPNLAKWAEDMNTNVLINEAKLILTGANDLINGVNNDTAMFSQPVQLIVVKANEDDSYSILPDQMVGTNYFNGLYDPKTDQVWFRISEYVQDLVKLGSDAENYGLFVYTYSGSYNAKRWVFNGPDSPDTNNRVKLEIIYSKIDD